MNVAIASTGLGHVARGIEAWAMDLGRALRGRSGVRVSLWKGGGIAEGGDELVIPCWQREEKRTQRLLRCVPSRFFWRLGLSSGYGIEQLTFAMRLWKHLNERAIDILHVQDPRVALLMQWAQRLGLVKTRTILGHGTEEPLDFIKRIDYLHHLAPWHLEEAKRAGVWKKSWTTIPNFIDTEIFNQSGANLRGELGIAAEDMVIVTAAAIKREHKRIDYLIDEFALLRQKRPELNAWLIVAGGWEDDTDELIRAGTAKLGKRVRFLVRFPRNRMPELYRTADLFVLPSLFEMLGIVLLEAMACGVPCVVHCQPVLEWVVGPGGIAIDMAGIGELAKMMDEILANETLRQALGHAAPRHCVENFSTDRVVDQILEYYQFVMNHDPKQNTVREGKQ